MVVDDEEFCLNSMRVILRSLGIDVENQVDFCINGEDALRTFETAYEHRFEYSMVILDFNMPKVDGLEASLQMRFALNNKMGIAQSSQPFIVGVTGYTSQDQLTKGTKAGMDVVLSKPLYKQDIEKLFADFGMAPPEEV